MVSGLDSDILCRLKLLAPHRDARRANRDQEPLPRFDSRTERLEDEFVGADDAAVGGMVTLRRPTAGPTLSCGRSMIGHTGNAGSTKGG